MAEAVNLFCPLEQVQSIAGFYTDDIVYDS